MDDLIDSADWLIRQSEPRLWAELGTCLEFSLNLHPDEAKEIEDTEDRELSHISNRPRTSGDDHSSRDDYFWIEERNKRLYLIGAAPVRLCIPKGPVGLKPLQENMTPHAFGRSPRLR